MVLSACACMSYVWLELASGLLESLPEFAIVRPTRFVL